MTKKETVPAGDFTTWLQDTRNATLKDLATDVPCGSCTACCTSSYFIHIRPHEEKTMARIPKELLFPAPGLPKGHKVMGFDEKGHCPMLKDNACSIYKDRPLTCRTYDCRVFCATGLPAGDNKKSLINEKIETWRFSFASDDDRNLYNALRKTVKFLVKNKKDFPKDFIPSNTTQLAILAIKLYPLISNSEMNCNKEILIQKMIDTIK